LYSFRIKFRPNPRRIIRIFLISVILLFGCILTNSLPPSRDNTSFLKKQTPAFVITVRGHDQRVPTVTNLFKKYANLDLSPFYGVDGNIVYRKQNSSLLAPGERGVRETMKRFFNMTLVKNYKEVFVIEDDAIPHFNFTSLFKQLSNRCQEADVLLLGATIWSDSQGYLSSGPCFDVDHRIFGAFALYIKRSAFKPIINWLETEVDVAYDHVYVPLQKQGLIVRVTHSPFLAIPDVSHSSLVHNNRGKVQFDMKKRALLHGWQLDSYPIKTLST
jgi:hypothetical protein